MALALERMLVVSAHWARVAVYLGLRDEEDAEWPSTGLDLLGRSLRVYASSLTWAAGVGAAAMLALFSGQATAVAGGTLLGGVIWGAMAYFTDVRPRLPRGALQTVPPDAIWERSMTRELLRRTPRLLLAVPLCVAFAWFADRADLGSVFVPGQYAGYAAASFFGAWRVRRWERHNHLRVAFRRDEGNEQLFAIPPRAATAR